jgi:hypothetical protein
MLPGGDKGLAGMQSMLLPMMMMGGDSEGMLDKMMPLMLMNQMGGADSGGGMGNMMQMMMMMQMLKGGDNPMGSLFGANKSSNRPFIK